MKTNNIVAQFASSLDANGKLKEYPVVAGSIFNEEYSETLDSATIVLSQVFAKDRLSYLKAYEYVRVFDKSGNTNFDQLYLIDNFDEKENNIHEHIFGYTINLMSETKWLEKWQCPSLTITHKVNNDGTTTKKTIYEYIKQYMNLYVPKVKFTSDGENWSYEPLIKVPGESETNLDNDIINHRCIVGTGTIKFYSNVTYCDSFDISTSSISGRGIYFRNNLTFAVTIPQGFSLGYYVNSNHRYDIVFREDVTIEPNTTYDLGYALSSDDANSFTNHQMFDDSKTITFSHLEYNPEFVNRFNVTCADMGFDKPTLRQLLTTLMQQVGCIPTVKNRVLGFLDFQKDAVPFGGEDKTIGNTVNFIRRSLSSDSFVNSLVNISDTVLDSGNEVICETLGFRDSSNVLLKQRENLVLETSFPIYKINKCILHFPGKYTGGYISSSYNCFNIGSFPGNHPVFYYKENTIANNVATVVISCSFNASSSYSVDIADNKIYFLARDTTTGVYSIAGYSTFNDFTLNSSNTVQTGMLFGGYGVTAWNKTFTFTGLANNVVGFFLYGKFRSSEDSWEFSFIKFDDNDPHIKYGSPDGSTSSSDLGGVLLANSGVAGYQLSLAGTRDWDITKLVVENGVRQLLERDFTKMNSELPQSALTNPKVDKIERLSKYVYGTVGYSIGAKQISGFSEVFNVGETTLLGWLTKEYSYIENIINVLQYDFSCNEDLLMKQFEFFKYIPITFGFSNSTVEFPSIMSYGSLINYNFSYYNPTTGDFTNSSPFFTSCFVDLYYQPLNSFNLAYVKSNEDIDIPLEQYDSNISGLTDFDRLSIHEQEQVDRIGNEVLAINQRTTNIGDIQTFDNGPLEYLDDTNRDGEVDDSDKGVKYIVFKRSFTINNNCFNASYTASKDAVLKNYFTSIRTKYRAYQYVDYNKSTLRKERDTFFVRVASDWYRGDNRVWLGNYQNGAHQRSVYNTNCLIYDLSNENTKTISYECEYDRALIYNGIAGNTTEMQTTKNSVSLVSTKNTIGIIYENVDNVGAGPYIKDLSTNSNLGGVPQYWQIWDTSYAEKHIVSFVSDIDFYSLSTTESGNTSTITNNVKKWGQTPIVANEFLNLPSSSNVIFSICDDNMISYDDNYRNVARTFYKDLAERINHSVQFIYYAPYNDILFSEDFVVGAPLVGKFSNPFNMIYSSDNFDIRTDKHDVDSSYHELVNGFGSGSITLIKQNVDVEVDIGYQWNGVLLMPNKLICHISHRISDEITSLKQLTILFSQMSFSFNDSSAVIEDYSYNEATKRIMLTFSVDYNVGEIPDLSSFAVVFPYTYVVSDFYTPIIEKIDGENEEIDRLVIKWNVANANCIKLCSKDENNQIVDIATFRRINTTSPRTTYFFTINDTKTDYVLSSQNGVVYRRAIVKKSSEIDIVSTQNIDQAYLRKCEKIYNEIEEEN